MAAGFVFTTAAMWSLSTLSTRVATSGSPTRGHLVGVAGGPRPAETEAARPKPELLRPLDEYAAVAGGTF